MGIRAQFATNQTKEQAGIAIPMGKNDDGTIPTFIVSRMSKSNTEYTKALEAATRPHRRLIAMKLLPEATADDIFRTVFATAVLKGWNDVQEEDGTPIPFTVENAKKLLSELPELYSALQDAANEAANFRDEMLKDEAKN